MQRCMWNSVFFLSYFLSCANPCSTLALNRINRDLKIFDNSETKIKEDNIRHDKGELKDRIITLIGK